MEADAVNSTADEGIFCTQMALDPATGYVYFGFNKGKTDSSAFAPGLLYYDPSAKALKKTIVTDKVLGVTINNEATNLF